MRDRLTVAAVFGGVRQRAWSVLIVSAFLVLGAAGAAGPMFAEASGNAAFQVRQDEIPASARQNDAAVVRVSADVGPRSADQQPVMADLRAVPGLGEPDLTGQSIGAELASPQYWGFTVSAGGKQERGRFFTVQDPAAELVAQGPAGRDGLWLPEPVAAELGVRTGDKISLSLRQGARGTPRNVATTVSGVYAVDAGGRLPADVPGSRKWSLRRGDTPPDTEYETLPAYLLVGDLPTVERLAQSVDDPLFWSVEAALTPGTTLADARRTAHEVELLRRRYAQAQPMVDGEDPLALRFATGISRIVATAQTTTEAVRQRTRPVEWAAITIGLASVLAVALLSARRRERELRHAAAVGMSPVRVGGLWLLEHLLPAVAGAALGWLVAWQLVVRLGPPGTVTESLVPAARSGGAAVLAGLAAVAAVAMLAAYRRVRPAPPATARRALPWGSMVVITALVAAGGLISAGGPAGGVDLLVPLLVLAAVGVFAGWLPSRLAGRQARLPGSPARAVLWLARRRLGSGGAERRLTVVVVTAGLGMLLFALSAVHSTEISADDRVAVAAGAEGVGVLEGSWQLDEAAPLVPKEDPLNPPSFDPVAGVRVPPLPPGSTVVWRTDVRTLLDDDQKDLLVIDPARFAEVALWGRGADLAEARAAVAALAAEPVDAIGRPRVITVADPASDDVDTIRMEVGFGDQYFEVAARVPAFPGQRGRPMYVAAADPTLGKLGFDDPRLRPRNQLSNSVFPQVFLWSSGGADGVQAVVAPHKDVQPERIDTAAALRQGSDYVATSRARGYQLAIAGYLALLAILTLCIYAQRTAALRRPADLMLARVGLGRRRVGRARAVEFVLLATISFAASVAGVLALAPLGARLLDDQPGLLPRLLFTLSPTALVVTACAAVLATLLAVLVARDRSSSEEAAYRDE
jgi:putative ABC transport system permease protein